MDAVRSLPVPRVPEGCKDCNRERALRITLLDPPGMVQRKAQSKHESLCDLPE